MPDRTGPTGPTGPELIKIRLRLYGEYPYIHPELWHIHLGTKASPADGVQSGGVWDWLIETVVNPNDVPKAVENPYDVPKAVVNPDDAPKTVVNADDAPKAVVNPDDAPKAVVNPDDGPKTIKIEHA
ncbi:hypothetical protein FOL47_000728 [Perkinsus chesapeaki]|uniref:Uncharacterized protein n=1 Tax=Perkinsus chesapeaki TaxID=330153 RepID=A0A7J6ML49_PERCH|nr:hypothetical protein FOL47_000728 [Perkinsus chesapeaki]